MIYPYLCNPIRLYCFLISKKKKEKKNLILSSSLASEFIILGPRIFWPLVIIFAFFTWIYIDFSVIFRMLLLVLKRYCCPCQLCGDFEVITCFLRSTFNVDIIMFLLPEFISNSYTPKGKKKSEYG